LSQEDTLRMAAEIVDKWSGPLRDMTKAVHSLHDMLTKTHEEGSKHAKEQAKEQAEVSERMKETGRTIREIVTPSMAALGISVLGAGETIAKLIEKLKEAGEGFYKIQGVIAHTGWPNEKVQVYTKALEEMGVPTEQAQKSLSDMGDALARLGRRDPEEVRRWSSMFNNIDPLIAKLEHLHSTAERMDEAFDFFKRNPNIPPDQKAKFFGELLHMPPELAAVTAKQWEEEIEHAREFFAQHPPLSTEDMWNLKESFRTLREEIEGIGQDFLDAFAGRGADAVRSLAEVIHHNVEDMKQLGEDLKAIGEKWERFKGRLGIPEFSEIPENERVPAKPPWTARGLPPFDGSLGSKAPGGGFHPMAFEAGSDTEAMNLMARATKTGVLEALREFAGMAPPGGQTGGFQNAAYTVGGGAGWAMGAAGRGATPRSWGGGGYRALSEGEVPAGEAGHGGRVSASRMGTAQIVADEWSRAGMSRDGIAGLMQNLMDESSLNPNLRHFDQPKFSGEAAFAHGLYQEGGTEWNHYSAWLSKNYPGADWRDPALQSRFAAWNLKTNYPSTWQKMLHADRFHAAADYVNEYLKPAAQYRYGRMSRYLHGGVADLDKYTGGRSIAAHLHDMVSRGGLHSGGGSSKVEGSADLNVRFENAPPGAQAFMKYNGLFKSGRVDWGYSMPPSDPGGGN